MAHDWEDALGSSGAALAHAYDEAVSSELYPDTPPVDDTIVRITPVW